MPTIWTLGQLDLNSEHVKSGGCMCLVSARLVDVGFSFIGSPYRECLVDLAKRAAICCDVQRA